MQKKYIYIIIIFLVVAILAVFGQVGQFDYVNIDDGRYVVYNDHLRSGITMGGVLWAFSTTYAEFWHPLTWVSLMLDHQLYGTNPGGYHATNLILHVLSTLLLFGLFCRITGAIWKSAFVAAVFGLHPLHMESVAWISERKDVLSAFFWMLTLYLYVDYTEKPTIKRYVFIILSFIGGLMSKSMIITLPAIMILLDYWPLNRFDSRKNHVLSWQLKEKLPLFILSAVFSIITFYAQYRPSAKGFPLSARLANASVACMKYLYKTFLPFDLAVFYPFPEPIIFGQVLVSVLLMIIITIMVIKTARRLPYLLVGWFWYVITLLPVLGIIQIGSFEMADRYTYIASIGLSVMVAWGIPSMIIREDNRKKIIWPAGITIVVMLAALTWKQCGYWKNSLELWNHALQVTENNFVAHTNISDIMLNKGNFENAIYHLNEAIRLKPDSAAHYYNRAHGYTAIGEYQRAIEDYNVAILLQKDFTDAYYNRAHVYLSHGNNVLGCPDARKACELGNCKLLELARESGLCP